MRWRRNKIENRTTEAEQHFCIYCALLEEELVPANRIFFNDFDGMVFPVCEGHEHILLENDMIKLEFCMN